MAERNICPNCGSKEVSCVISGGSEPRNRCKKCKTEYPRYK